MANAFCPACETLSMKPDKEPGDTDYCHVAEKEVVLVEPADGYADE